MTASRSPVDRPFRQARRMLRRRDPLWPEHLGVLAVILLSLALPDQLTLGPPWLLPAIAGVLFAGLVASTPRHGQGERPHRRHLRIGLVGLMSAGNVASLLFLARYGVEAHRLSGHALLAGGVVLWISAVLLYALWYWEMDRGGPLQRGELRDARVDFVFPQMQDERLAPDDWTPGFADFLYLSLMNAATFAPPEAHFPLTGLAKLVMSLQSVGALATDALIVARAVNIIS